MIGNVLPQDYANAPPNPRYQPQHLAVQPQYAEATRSLQIKWASVGTSLTAMIILGGGLGGGVDKKLGYVLTASAGERETALV